MSRTMLGATAVLVALALGAPAAAQVMRGATAASTQNGERPAGNLPTANIINQSGLSTGYASGTTNFDTYVPSTTSAGTSATSGATGSTTASPIFRFDLGANYDIDGIAVWSWDSGGNINQYQLYSFSDDQFGGQTLLGTFAAPERTVRSALVGRFATVNVRYLQIVGTDYSGTATTTTGGTDEVAFRQVLAAAPEPAMWGMMLLGFGIVGYAMRRRRVSYDRAAYAA